MNWVDYSGQIIVVQGCVIAEINGYPDRTQGCIDTSPLRYGHPPLDQGWEATTVRLHFFVWLVFQSLCGSDSSTLSHFQIFPFRTFLDTYLWHLPHMSFDLSYLSGRFLETVISSGTPIAWNMYFMLRSILYFGWQLKELQRALDYAWSADTQQPYYLRNSNVCL